MRGSQNEGPEGKQVETNTGKCVKSLDHGDERHRLLRTETRPIPSAAPRHSGCPARLPLPDTSKYHTARLSFLAKSQLVSTSVNLNDGKMKSLHKHAVGRQVSDSGSHNDPFRWGTRGCTTQWKVRCSRGT